MTTQPARDQPQPARDQPQPVAGRQLTTAIPGLILKELTVRDAETYYGVLDGNRDHLSRHGDYRDEANATPAWVTDHLAQPAPIALELTKARHLAALGAAQPLLSLSDPPLL